MQTAIALFALVALQAASPAAAQGQGRTVWALVLNEEPKDDIDVVLLADGPWVDPASLLRAGVERVPEGTRRSLTPGALPWVSLASLAPDITYRLDEENIRLILTADPKLLATSAFALSNPRPEGWKVTSSPSVFLNYSANWTSDVGTAGYGELGFHWHGLLSTAAGVDDKGAVTMGLSSWTFDQVRARRRWVVGDTIGRSTTLGSTPVVGGFSVGTHADLDPYYAAYPAPSVRGAVRTPSIADVYVDGRLVSSVRLAPGQFTLTDLPIETGLGNARVIIRDTFGRQQEVALGFYLTTQLLKKGEQDYSYVAGKERIVDGTKIEYGRSLGTLFHSAGITDWLTVGGQAEGSKDLVSGGAGLQARLWRLGVFGVEALASQAESGDQGYAATGVYSFLTNRFSAELHGTWIGAGFQNLFLAPAAEDQLTMDGSTTVTLGLLGSLTVGGTFGNPSGFATRVTQSKADYLGRVSRASPDTLSKGVEEKRQRLLRLGYSVNLTSRVQFTASATRTIKPDASTTWEGFGSINVALGGRAIASTTTSVDADGEALTTLNVQRSLPMGPGIGFRVDADAQDPYRSQGTLEVQLRRGVLGVRVDGAKDSDVTTTFNVAGSLVAIGREVLLSRPVDDGFVLVKVPNARGVRVNANNQYSGRTGRRGSLFVPDLHSYLSSPIGIEQEDLPVDVRLGATQQIIAVPYRGGVVVRFEAQVIRALVGRLDTGGDPAAFGTLVVTAGALHFESPLNATGEFYFEDLPPGDYVGVATWGNRTCRAALTMPDGRTPITDLGAVKCVEDKR